MLQTPMNNDGIKFLVRKVLNVHVNFKGVPDDKRILLCKSMCMCKSQSLSSGQHIYLFAKFSVHFL